MLRPKNYRKRNVWFLEMGQRESKIKSTPRTPTRPDRESAPRTMSSGPHMAMKPVQSTNPEPVPVWPDNSVRWQSLYDVYICHSKEEADCSYAMEMLSYLEQQPEKLRCFLPMRDMLWGGPIPSEMCSGLENSHCWVMLLTPHFLSDDWCKYQMNQFLAHAPCANGRLIPVVIGLTLAQYPSEVKFMYAFKGTLNDKSVFSKIKGAIITYLKEMLTVTSEQIASHSPNNRIPEVSQSTSKTLENSQVESSVTQESTCDRSIRSSVTQETASDMSMRSSVIQKFTSDMTSRSPITQEKTSEKSLRVPVTQETTNDIYSISPITQETATEVPLKDLGSQETTIYRSMSSSEQETSSDMSSRNSVTQETTSDMSLRSPVTHEAISEVSLRSFVSEETNSDMSMQSSVTNSDISMESSMTGPKTISIRTSLTTSDISMRSFVTGQETTSDLSMRNSRTRQETTSHMSMSNSVAELETPYWLQEKYSDLSLSPELINTRDVCKDFNCIMTATKDSFSQETRIDTSGVWSMTTDLHTDCSDLHTCDVQTASKYSDCRHSDFYTSRIDGLPGQKDS